MRKDLDLKRAIKRQVRGTRQQPVWPVLPIESLPIRRRALGPYVHFPASPEDIGETLRRLPTGVVDGLTSITLCLMDQDEITPGQETTETYDPFIHRAGVEILPQVFAGEPLGVYFVRSRKIQLYAYVYDPQMPDREMWEVLLRLQMLATLVHEIAHHQDFTMRRGRGRWLGEHWGKNETYAEQTEQAWVKQAVMPYLQAAYPDAAQNLERWLSQHLGMPISLDFLCDAPSSKLAEETVQTCCPAAWEALSDVILDAAQGESLATIRLAFSDYLYVADRPQEAMQIVDRVLTDSPDHVAGRASKAWLLADQGHYRDAECLAQSVLREQGEIADAWGALTKVYLAESRWLEIPEAASRGIAATKDDDDGLDWFMSARSLAHLMLEQFSELEPDLVALGRSRWELVRNAARAMRSAMLLFQQRFADAHDCAKPSAKSGAQRLGSETLMLAVRVVAADRQGIADEEAARSLAEKRRRLVEKRSQDQSYRPMLTLVDRVLATLEPASLDALINPT